MKKTIVAIVAIVLIGTAVPYLYANRMEHRGMHGAGGDFPGMMMLGHLQKLKTELGITDDQAQKIKDIALAVREKNAPFRDQMHQNMQEAAKVLLADPNNVAGAQAILDRQLDSERQMKSNMLSGVAKALAVLTPDQRTKLGEILEQHAANHGR